jgi:hypothetical protein
MSLYPSNMNEENQEIVRLGVTSTMDMGPGLSKFNPRAVSIGLSGKYRPG